MKLTSLHQNLLVRINTGETTFSSETEEMTLEDFQTVAKALIELEENNYIQMNTPHEESRTGSKYIDIIINCRLVK